MMFAITYQGDDGLIAIEILESEDESDARDEVRECFSDKLQIKLWSEVKVTL